MSEKSPSLTAAELTGIGGKGEYYDYGFKDGRNQTLADVEKMVLRHNGDFSCQCRFCPSFWNEFQEIKNLKVKHD